MLKLFRLERRIVIKAFFFTALFFFVAHLSRFTSLSFTHDSVLINQNNDAFAQITLGRFLQPLYWKLRGDIPVPFLVGVISYIALSSSIVLIIRLLDLRSTLSIVLTCSVLSANATLIYANSTYISWTDVYMISLFLSSLCVFVCDRFRFGFLAAPFFLCASLALYQSYIQIAALLFLMLLVQSALRRDSSRTMIFSAFKYLFVLISGLLLYSAVLTLILHITGASLADQQNGLASIGQYDGISILKLIRDTYIYPFQYFCSPRTHLSFYVSIATLLIFCLGLVCLIYLLYVRKPPLSTVILTIGVILLMPIAMNIVYFISKGYVHPLMIYSFFLAYVFPIFLFEQALHESAFFSKGYVIQRLAAGLVLFIYFCNFVTASHQYLRRDLEFQSTLSLMTRIIDRAEQIEGYEPGYTPVAILGDLVDSPLNMSRPALSYLSNIYRDNNYSITYPETITW